MIEGALGIIEKMRIEIYPNDSYKEYEAIKTIFVQINPEKYSTTQTVHYHDDAPQGASGQNLQFNKITGDEVTFDFLFDSSGVVPPAKILDGKQERTSAIDNIVGALSPAIVNPFGEAASVEKELEEFKTLLSGYNGDTHEPRYLRLIWGGYQLECRCTSITTEYKLFRRDGRPIRANAKCGFKGTQSYELMQAAQNQQSPDVTHVREAASGDPLPFMATQIYKNNTYYIDVAKANKLLSFRDLKNVATLQFPPVK